MSGNTQERLVEQLKQLREQHLSTAEMLAVLVGELRASDENHGPLNIICVVIFRKAFGLGISEAMPIGGWQGFGERISDRELNETMDPLIYR